MFFRLSPEEKVVGLGILITLIGLFLPWYSVVFAFDKTSASQSGFSGDLGVIGFIVFLMLIIAALVLTGEYLYFRLPQFGYSKEQILFFLMGEGAFLTLIAIAVYTKRSLEFTNAEIRFGIYMSLIGACLATFAAYAQMQKLKKKDVEAFFEHTEEPKPPKKSHAKKEEPVVEEPVEEEPELFEPEKEMPLPEESDFLVDEGVMEEALLEEEEVIEAKPEPEAELEVVEEIIEEVIEEEPVVEETLEEEAEEMKEEVIPEEPAEDEEEPKKEKKNQSTLDFYQDE